MRKRGVGHFAVTCVEEAAARMAQIQESAKAACDWLASQTGDSLATLKQIKFHKVGFHPIENSPLNLAEQINKTWSYAVSIAAVRQLLEMHPDALGFNVAPGAHAALELDIMSINPGLVGAETFAAVSPKNNNKLASDVANLVYRSERHRYVFFMSPQFPGNHRRPEFERNGVEVWSVDI